MTRAVVLQAAKRGRGNPNWGKFFRPLPVVLTEFEVQAKRLGISREQYVSSAPLRSWCERNRNRCSPRISVSRSVFALIDDRDRAYFGRGGQEDDKIGFLDESTRAIFGRSGGAPATLP